MDPLPSPPEHLLAALEPSDGTDAAAFCGRFAPSPSGTLHLGNLSTALASWLQARRQGGLWRLRIDDLDTPRVRPGSIDSIQRDLLWLGLTWDGPLIRQSQHRGTYYSWLSWLRRSGQLFPCGCSRRDLAGARVYPGSCRGGERGWGWKQGRLPSWRLRVPPQDPHGSGDVIVRRADGIVAYQLASVLDDLRAGITDVVRGEDLRDAEAAQCSVFAAIGKPPPRFHYVPLITDGRGEKLSKREDSAGLQRLIAQGTDPAAVVGHLAAGLGLLPDGQRCSAQELLQDLT